MLWLCVPLAAVAGSLAVEWFDWCGWVGIGAYAAFVIGLGFSRAGDRALDWVVKMNDLSVSHLVVQIRVAVFAIAVSPMPLVVGGLAYLCFG